VSRLGWGSAPPPPAEPVEPPPSTSLRSLTVGSAPPPPAEPRPASHRRPAGHPAPYCLAGSHQLHIALPGPTRPPPSTSLRSLPNPYHPEPISVVARDGLPVMVQVRKRNLRVREIMNTWRIEEEWWRAPISRLYFLLELENGMRLTLFVENGNWYRQNWV